MEQCIRATCHESARSWLEALGTVEFALNSAVSDATGVSPFVVLFGCEPRVPVDSLDGMHVNDAAQRVVRDRE